MVKLTVVLSLLVWAAAIVEYVRSYVVQDVTDVGVCSERGDYAGCQIAFSRGQLRLSFTQAVIDAGYDAGEQWSGVRVYRESRTPAQFSDGPDDPPQHRHWASAGFGIGRDYDHGMFTGTTQRYVLLPLWAVLVPLSVFAFVWLRGVLWKRRRARRVRMGLCSICGYDLRASPRQCPECGVELS